MAIAEKITSGYYRIYEAAEGLWNRKSFWNRAQDTEFDDGMDAETKVGAIKGITTSTNVKEEGFAADATVVSALSKKFSLNKTYVNIKSDENTNVERSTVAGAMYENNPMVGYMHDNASGKTVDSVGIMFDGTNFYAVGNKAGADTVTKKLGSTIVDLGTKTSFDVSSYDDYKNFTTSNFLIDTFATTSLDAGFTHGWDQKEKGKGSVKLVKSYDSSTGKLSAYVEFIVQTDNDTGNGWDTQVSKNIPVKVYLVY